MARIPAREVFQVSKKQTPFNNPFGKVTLKQEEPKKVAPSQPPPAPRAPARARSTTPDDDSDAALFREAIGEVEVVRAGKQRVGPPPRQAAEIQAATKDDAEALARLSELVSSDEFEVVDSSSLIEGAVRGLDANLLKRLRGGDFGIDASLDLHGQRREEARASLERFVSRARVEGHRCVLVVTGRGLNSEDQVPVLKQGVQEWLTHGRVARQVLAFCSARPRDGGAGAVYVLLRR